MLREDVDAVDIAPYGTAILLDLLRVFIAGTDTTALLERGMSARYSHDIYCDSSSRHAESMQVGKLRNCAA